MDSVQLFTGKEYSYKLTKEYLLKHEWFINDAGLLEFDMFKNKHFWRRFFIGKFNDGGKCVIRGKNVEGDIYPLCELDTIMDLNELVAAFNLELDLPEKTHGWKTYLFPDRVDYSRIRWDQTHGFKFTEKNKDNKEFVDSVWDKGKAIEGIDKNMFRLDACGALMFKGQSVVHSDNGWVMSRIDPNGDDSIENLRPMNWINDFYKGNDYPSYLSKVRFDGVYNVLFETNMTIKRDKK